MTATGVAAPGVMLTGPQPAPNDLGGRRSRRVGGRR
jgi:hypothetical protein